MIDIKVCGMRDAENVRDVLSLKPNLMGFIFYEKSKRYVERPFADKTIDFNNTQRVGVFVKATIEEISRHVKDFDLQYVQLHGDESPSFCQEATDLGIEVIKVFRVNENFDWSSVKPFEGKASCFLFDTKGTASDAETYGGLGRKFDWGILDGYPSETPFYLSGGIHLEDVPAIMALELPLLKGIDINSGFETEPGFKDLGKLTQCFKEIRR